LEPLMCGEPSGKKSWLILAVRNYSGGKAL
jgi:hypothetical protein